MAVEDAESRYDHRRRLSPQNRDKDLLPLRRAHDLTVCSLYWLPAPSSPPQVEQKLWLLAFFEQLSKLLSAKFELRSELFLQMKVVYPNLLETFVENLLEFNPLLGLTLRPGTTTLPVITEADVKELVEGHKKFNFGDYVGDYAFWFVDKQPQRQLDLFFGFGGITMLFLKPDQNTQPPDFKLNEKVLNHPAIKPLDVKRHIVKTYALADSFRTKSKELFCASELPKSQVAYVPFVIPLLRSGDFFSQPKEESDKWFTLFDAYVTESPVDKGILLASKLDIEDGLIGILADLKRQSLKYTVAV